MKKKTAAKTKRKDLLIILVLPLLTGALILLLNLNFLITTLLFFGLPSLFLSIKNPKEVFKAIIVSLFGGTVNSFIAEYAATTHNLWQVQTVFPFKLLGLLPVEELIWGILLLYSIIMFYDYFLDKSRHLIKIKRYLIGFIYFLSLTFISFVIRPNVGAISPYFYLMVGLIGLVLPSVVYLIYQPTSFLKFFKTSLYTFYVGIIFEIISVKLGHWVFTGDKFIAWIEFWGAKFPFEELLCWQIVVAFAILAYYELFGDDNK